MCLFVCTVVCVCVRLFGSYLDLYVCVSLNVCLMAGLIDCLCVVCVPVCPFWLFVFCCVLV